MSAKDAMKEADDAKVSILIVDDRPDKLLTYEVMLAELKENIVRATSGKEALRCLLRQDFAVILLDVNMPGMDGFETAALIRQRPRSETTPIIFISAVNDTINHISRGYSLGAVDYMLTPVVPEILRAKIAVFVDLFRKTEQVKRQAEERAKLIREQAARAEAEAQQEHLRFLADASNVLGGSLDYHATFHNLAQLIVPRLSDFCVIHIAKPEGGLDHIAIAPDDAKTSEVQDLKERYVSSLTAKRVATKVFQNAKSEICCDMDDATLRELFDREDDGDFIRSFQATSFLAVPLRGHDGVLGTITMVSTTVRPCGPNELSLAEELAQRAALAVDNAGLYKEAQRARTEAERASLAKDRFLAMLSHELRTPLTPVLASISALEFEDDVPENMREPLELIRRNVELEARLIDDFLDLTRISKGKVQLSFEVVDAHRLLRNALEICRSEIDQKHLALQTEFSASKVHLRADPARLQQIFWNLIKNAVKFTPERGNLAIRTTNESDGQLRVEVEDSGCGIDPVLLPKMFNAFEQGERAQLGGLGLGLAISKALVESHGGQIHAESPGLNLGAKFTTTFSTCEKGSSPNSTDTPSTNGSRRSVRILLVEDHEDTNRSLTKLLQRRGHHVHSAHSVQSALNLAAAEEFDVLISDLGLPDGNGTDLLRTLGTDRQILSIALTGFGMEEDIRLTREVGFSHHLVKPVDLNRLDSIIQQGS
ncbi:MAG: sensor hybrid histidine kinase [Spartobacteria bacterium]|nr:sensor hybrid histidine kinase [Spartobacteria bacterium]